MLLGYRVIEGALNIINPKLEKKFLGKANTTEKRAYNLLWKLFWVAILAAIVTTSLKVSYGTTLLLIAFTLAIVRQSLRTYMKIKYGLSTAFIKKIIKYVFKIEVSKEIVYIILIVNMLITIALVIIGYVVVLNLLR